MQTESPTSPLIIMLAYHYPPSNQAGAVRPAHFAKYLQRLGYTVKVITASRQDPQTPRPEVVFVPNRHEKPNRYRPAGFTEMVLRKLFFPYDDGMLWSLGAFHAAEALVRSNLNAVVFSTFPPVNTHLTALRLKRKYPIRWIADFRDPLVGAPGRILCNEQQRFGRLASSTDVAIEPHVFRNADAVIANTDNVLERWRKRYPEWQNKLSFIWNGFDSEESIRALPIPHRSYKELAHVGSIYAGRHPGAVLAAMDRLIARGRVDPARFRINLVGLIDEHDIPDRDLFHRLQDLGCLQATGKPIPQAQARQVLCEADYLLLLDVTFLDAGQQLPSKIFEYVQIGRPVLAVTAHNSPAERILTGSGLPHVCIYGDSSEEQAENAVLNLLAFSSEPVKASDWFRRQFDAAPRAEQLSDIIEVAVAKDTSCYSGQRS